MGNYSMVSISGWPQRCLFFCSCLADCAHALRTAVEWLLDDYSEWFPQWQKDNASVFAFLLSFGNFVYPLLQRPTAKRLSIRAHVKHRKVQRPPPEHVFMSRAMNFWNFNSLYKCIALLWFVWCAGNVCERASSWHRQSGRIRTASTPFELSSHFMVCLFSLSIREFIVLQINKYSSPTNEKSEEKKRTASQTKQAKR